MLSSSTRLAARAPFTRRIGIRAINRASQRGYASTPGSSRRFVRTVGLWALGTGSLALAGYSIMKDELPALDTHGPPRSLSLKADTLHRGHPVVDIPKTDGKERVVVLGSGWGATSLLKTLNASHYDVVSVSPVNYFVFTPLLPSATVGTVECRSVLEPIRRILKRTRGVFIEAEAVDVDFEARRVLVDSAAHGGKAWVPYDRLVIGVGAQSMTRGVKGLEFTHRLKTIHDARAIRQHIMDNFERAALPSTPLDEKKRLLTFVVCGGGPTGCEFAAELHDFLGEDLVHYFPDSVRELVNVIIVQSRAHILNMMDSKISEFAESSFARRNIHVVTNSRVGEVGEKTITYTTTQNGCEPVTHVVPQGFVLWSTGLALTPFTRLVCDQLEAQSNRHAITVDSRLRVKGCDGTVFALGDCATVEAPHLLEHICDLFDSARRPGSSELERGEFSDLVKRIARKYPETAGHLAKIEDGFEKFDRDGNGRICMDEFRAILEYVDSKMTALPALAQVASQEGLYLARAFNRSASHGRTIDEEPPFSYQHMGTLAYLGRAAAADFGDGRAYRGSNLAAMYLWRSVYWSMQVSLRTRLLLAIDWTKDLLFGRDISKV